MSIAKTRPATREEVRLFDLLHGSSYYDTRIDPCIYIITQGSIPWSKPLKIGDLISINHHVGRSPLGLNCLYDTGRPILVDGGDVELYDGQVETRIFGTAHSL